MRQWAVLFALVLGVSDASAQPTTWLLGIDELGKGSENAERLSLCLSQENNGSSCMGMISDTCHMRAEACTRAEIFAWQALGKRFSDEVERAGGSEIAALSEMSHHAWLSHAQARCRFRAAALIDEMPVMVRMAEIQCALGETVERVLDLRDVLLDLGK